MPRKWPLDAISQKIIVDLIIYRRLEFGGDWTDRGCAMVKSRWGHRARRMGGVTSGITLTRAACRVEC